VEFFAIKRKLGLFRHPNAGNSVKEAQQGADGKTAVNKCVVEEEVGRLE